MTECDGRQAPRTTNSAESRPRRYEPVEVLRVSPACRASFGFDKSRGQGRATSGAGTSIPTARNTLLRNGPKLGRLRLLRSSSFPALAGCCRVEVPVAQHLPHRSRRAAFPHRALVEGQTRPRFGAWTAPAPPARRLAASVTCRVRHWVRSMRCRSPSLRPAAFPPPSPPPICGRLCSRLHRYYAAVRLLTVFPDGFVSSTSRRGPGPPIAAAGGMRSPRFRRDPFVRDVVSDPGRATAPRIAAPHMLPSTVMQPPRPLRLQGISWLNPTPHTIAVYASPWSSPSTTQHSLPGGRYPLPGPDFHRLDRASFAWRTMARPHRRALAFQVRPAENPNPLRHLMPPAACPWSSGMAWPSLH